MADFIEIKGLYNTAKVFNPTVDPSSYEQVEHMMNREEFKDSKVRFMPDIHYGKGATVGTTMTVTDKVVPNFIGVDIGCGVSVTELDIPFQKARKKDFLKEFDKKVKRSVPLGFARHKTFQNSPDVSLDDFLVQDQLDEETFYTSIGTLGGGNHFISLEASPRGTVYLLIHTGSRNIGLTVAKTYQALADEEHPYKNIGEGYVTGETLECYLHDLHAAQQYARQNRKAIRDNILKSTGLENVSSFDTVHNYIEIDTMIARKGAVSAKKGETLIIPFNSRDGSVIAVGKGNEDWNFSAPHGAGRTMSRNQARKQIPLESYQKMMTGVYSSSVSKATVDEAPLAYKKQEEILTLSEPTIEVVERLKPIYNLKG